MEVTERSVTMLIWFCVASEIDIAREHCSALNCSARVSLSGGISELPVW